MKKILLLCVTSQNVVTFRAGLIKILKEKGHAVSVIAFDDEYKDEIEKFDIDFYCIREENRGLNPLKILSLKGKYRRLIHKIAPDAVLTFMLKPNTFGVMAAKSEGITSIYSMVEGAGDVFVKSGFKWKMIRFVVCALYKKAFKASKKVFFLNNDDKTEFLERRLVKENQCELVHGIGVDLEKFTYVPVKAEKTFLMVARMLETKGVYEYCKCARIVKQKYPDAIFNYLGAEGTIRLSDVAEYIDDGSINYLGTTKDVRPYLEDCTVLLLPSYREGMPMSIMEAESVGRAIITTDSVGCRDTVVDGYNGFLVAQGDYSVLAEKCLFVIENFDKIKEMGANARKFAEECFDSVKINSIIVKNIESDYETEVTGARSIEKL